GGANADALQVRALASILPTVLERLREVWIEALAAVPPDIGLMQSVVRVLLEAIASPAWAAAGGGPGDGGGQTSDSGSSRNNPATVVASWNDAPGNGRGHRTSGRGGGGGGGDGGVSAWFLRFVPLVLEAFPVRPLEGELLGDVEEERLRAIQGLNMGLCELVVAACAGPGAIAAGALASAGG
ncbi:unnamed protein product, partial [Scytosiphon promiscuus]